MAKSKLNLRQRKFVDGLFDGKTHLNAYKEAGYKPKDNHSASAGAYQLLQNIDIEEEIARRIALIERGNRIRLSKMSENAIIELHNMASKKEVDKIKLDAVKDMLDRSGLKPVEKIEQTTSQSHDVSFKLSGVDVTKILALRDDK